MVQGGHRHQDSNSLGHMFVQLRPICEFPCSTAYLLHAKNHKSWQIYRDLPVCCNVVVNSSEYEEIIQYFLTPHEQLN